jgi:hypothetical protein
VAGLVEALAQVVMAALAVAVLLITMVLLGVNKQEELVVKEVTVVLLELFLAALITLVRAVAVVLAQQVV